MKYSPAKEDISDGDCYCLLYYHECFPQIARVYDTEAQALAYLNDPTVVNKNNYRILRGKKYKEPLF